MHLYVKECSGKFEFIMLVNESLSGKCCACAVPVDVWLKLPAETTRSVAQFLGFLVVSIKSTAYDCYLK